jgi:hypothetical protein
MKKSIFTVGVISGMILWMVSCNCPDDIHNYLPEEAIRYLDEHDTIRYYCEEIDEYEEYIVCECYDVFEYDKTYDRCDQKEYYYTKQYHLFKDSCNNETKFWINISTMGYHDIDYHGSYPNQLGRDALHAHYESSLKTPIEVLGHTYLNTIFIGSRLDDSIVGIRFNYEYGVIQRVYEHLIYNLVNDENF